MPGRRSRHLSPDGGSSRDEKLGLAQAGAAIVQGLTDRTRNLMGALDRHDRLESARQFVGWLDDQVSTGAVDESAREVLLRAMRIAADPLNFRLLEAMDALESVGLPELMAASGMGRVAVSERVHDMLQVGLVSREMIDDQIRATPLAIGLCELVERLAKRAASHLAAELRRGPVGSAEDDKTRGDGSP